MRSAWKGLAAGLLVGASLLAGCEKKVTMSNFDQVQNGMTLSEVEAILGKGEKQAQGGVNISSSGLLSGSKGPSNQEVFRWVEGRAEITVTLQDGKVIMKNSAGL